MPKSHDMKDKPARCLKLLLLKEMGIRNHNNEDEYVMSSEFKQQPHRKGMATGRQGGGKSPVGLNGNEKDCGNTINGGPKGDGDDKQIFWKPEKFGVSNFDNL